MDTTKKTEYKFGCFSTKPTSHFIIKHLFSEIKKKKKGINIMKLKLIFLAIIFFCANRSLVTSNSVFECLIENIKQYNEYMCSSTDQWKTSRKNVSTKTPKLHKVYALTAVAVSNMNQLKWELIQVSGTYDTYLMRNKHSGEYLCASAMSENKRRLLFASQLSKRESVTNNKCKWRYERVIAEKSTKAYVIWNVEYKNEVLLADAFKAFKNKRSLSLKPVTKTFTFLSFYPDEYKWIVEC
jgi:hypothetical protein